MPLTPDQAAAVAKRHGLTLQDAAGLLSLADDADQADQIAARFAGTDDDTLVAYTRHLFGRTEPTAEPPAPPKTSTEAGNPPPPANPEDPRVFVRQLFNRTD